MTEEQKKLIDISVKNILDRNTAEIIRAIILKTEQVEDPNEKVIVAATAALRESVSLSVYLVLSLLEKEEIMEIATGRDLQKLLLEAFSEAKGL